MTRIIIKAEDVARDGVNGDYHVMFPEIFGEYLALPDPSESWKRYRRGIEKLCRESKNAKSFLAQFAADMTTWSLHRRIYPDRMDPRIPAPPGHYIFQGTIGAPKKMVDSFLTGVWNIGEADSLDIGTCRIRELETAGKIGTLGIYQALMHGTHIEVTSDEVWLRDTLAYSCLIDGQIESMRVTRAHLMCTRLKADHIHADMASLFDAAIITENSSFFERCDINHSLIESDGQMTFEHVEFLDTMIVAPEVHFVSCTGCVRLKEGTEYIRSDGDLDIKEV